MSGIFISYRRDDSGPWAGRINDALVARFGADHVFLDVDGIRPGEDYRHAITRTIDASDVALIVIGPSWLTTADDDGTPRLSIEGDVHRTEIQSVLESDVLVVPVLVGGATAPRLADLPDGLGDLSYRNAVAIDDRSFGRDMAALMDSLEEARKPPPKPRKPRRTERAPKAAATPRTRQPYARRPLVAIGAVVAVIAAGALAVALSGGDDPEVETASSTSSTSTTTTTTSSTTTTAAPVVPTTILADGTSVISGQTLPEEFEGSFEIGFAEHGLCLQSDDPSDPSNDHAAFIGGCLVGHPSQTWTVTLDDTGWYRLGNEAHGEGSCLSGTSEELAGGTAPVRMRPCTDDATAETQRWHIVTYDRGGRLFFLMTQAAFDDELCLSAPDPHDEPFALIMLADCTFEEYPPLWIIA